MVMKGYSSVFTACNVPHYSTGILAISLHQVQALSQHHFPSLCHLPLNYYSRRLLLAAEERLPCLCPLCLHQEKKR